MKRAGGQQRSPREADSLSVLEPPTNEISSSSRAPAAMQTVLQEHRYTQSDFLSKFDAGTKAVTAKETNHPPGSPFTCISSSPGNFTIRQAQLPDAHALAAVMIVASEDDPAYHYRFPRRRQFAMSHLLRERHRAEALLSDRAGKWRVMVAEIADGGNNGLTHLDASKIVAFSIWSLSREMWISNEQDDPNDQDDAARTISDVASTNEVSDASPIHSSAFARAIAKAKMTYLDGLSKRPLHLMVLGTLPAFRRQGAATRLVDWGKSKATEWGEVVTLFASPMGRELYRKLGFEEEFGVVVKASGDRREEWLWIWGMMWRGDRAIGGTAGGVKRDGLLRQPQGQRPAQAVNVDGTSNGNGLTARRSW